ncbi:DUF397 domain-containing protein [Micromonospora sp. KC606]|uniref:DUF397 domain-containing protein n=1 Tax=Micromonospora sp. KC606 TaxID=2530379 RepID=UPI00104362FD|nr:DUF397 domain-containing protein [Micromonospora sp. KC606]TDC71773.1 DUF397 domain-containing protein [Micromonospora sp. KC606]
MPDPAARGRVLVRSSPHRAASSAGSRRDGAGVPGVVGVRDSKDPTGATLVFSPAAWRAFVVRVADRA